MSVTNPVACGAKMPPRKRKKVKENAIVPRKLVGVAWPVEDGEVDKNHPAIVQDSTLSERYMDMVKRSPCMFPTFDCVVMDEPHHWPSRGRHNNGSGFRTVPLCVFHHRQFHNSGKCEPFSADGTRVAMVEWEAKTMAKFLEAME